MQVSIRISGSKDTETHFVTSKQNVRALQKTRAEQVAQGVIFLVEGKNGRRGDT